MSRRLKKFITIFLLLSGCSGLEQSEKEKLRRQNAHAEYIYRNQDEVLFSIDPAKRADPPKYPWHEIPDSAKNFNSAGVVSRWIWAKRCLAQIQGAFLA